MKFFSYIKTNWKTSAAGALTILSGIPAVTNIVTPIVTPILQNPPKNKVEWINIAIGIGLMFAKDHNVTGGSKANAGT